MFSISLAVPIKKDTFAGFILKAFKKKNKNKKKTGGYLFAYL